MQMRDNYLYLVSSQKSHYISVSNASLTKEFKCRTGNGVGGLISAKGDPHELP